VVAAWHAFQHAVRPELPALRCIFALLAGLAPLHAERTAQRGGASSESVLADPLSFYDTSSYGARAVRAMATAVRIGQLVHRSDFPVATVADDPVEEAFGAGFADVVRRNSASRALGYTWVPARARWRLRSSGRHDTGFHDHDHSAAAIAVLQGAIREERFALRGPGEHTLRVGEQVAIVPEAIHRVRHAGEGPAVTLHAYSPPLHRVGTYEVASDGALLRHPRPADVPLDAAA
jgi:mannose-6-phosphate isomerase-like protein (cupin superfamily)